MRASGLTYDTMAFCYTGKKAGKHSNTMFPYVASPRRSEHSPPLIGLSFVGYNNNIILNRGSKHFVSQYSPFRVLAT